MASEKGRICVTGAGGFIASWVIKFLLSDGYIVHGTVRDPCDYEKNGHLYKFENASKNLKLFKAELHEYDNIYSAIQACIGVFHIASPVPPSSQEISDPEKEVIEPAVTGTVNVMKASVKAKVKRVVYMSSSSAIGGNPSWPKGQPMDETSWSDVEYLKATKSWYGISKTLAEIKAWEFAKTEGLNVVSLCPALVLGPMLQSKINASSEYLIDMFKGLESMSDAFPMLVDVRDIAEAVILLYEKCETEGRYIGSAHLITTHELVDYLKPLYPNYDYPKRIIEGETPEFVSKKLQKLGWSYRPWKESVVDAVESYKKHGILN